VFLYSIALLHGLWSPATPGYGVSQVLQISVRISNPTYGDGQNPDFTFIDAIAANLAATVPAAIGQIFNIGGGSRSISRSDRHD